MKVAIVHDWLVNYGGAELFVEYLLKLYPDAELFTLVYDKKRLGAHFEHCKIHTSFFQRIPFSSKIYTKLLKFMPSAFESFDFSGFDLVISSSSSCAKGVITPPYVPHVAFIHSPMRYAWDLFFDYRKRSGFLTRLFMDTWMPQIRLWDYVSSQRVDLLAANSRYIARRIKKFWNRDAAVVYLPVDVSRFTPCDDEPDTFYVAFSRLVPYKRIDLAVSACKKLGRKLIVIGSGSEEKRLRKLAAGDRNIVFTGRLSDEALLNYLQRCRALIFCAEEDFGFVPLEVQACGRPVIAFGRGGAKETVVDGKTGIFFEKQETDSVADAILSFEALDQKSVFKKDVISAHAKSFTEERFQREFKALVQEAFRKATYQP
ncbi:glycosyltransferase [Treponema brennaborense]|uniref:Glycosyl transferase group 1 n=1 Tax=Treponema brennaborense (strain DSM 12168 / CIP 105900 / DD5/3) TaxID=906968 RepID=F4LMJ0_TREBD|nr:glycosyltransferase [Treponema brennaborense]AEE15752.1 glycosyl transferase group 1 [Treponema brennaborense DSM 12168]